MGVAIMLLPVAIYVLMPVAILSAIVTSFIIAHRNKKRYICIECGETYELEQMEARKCSICGSDLIEVKTKDLKDFRARNKNLH